jgi:DNA primase
VIDQAVRDRNLHSPADKAAAVEEALPFVRAVRSRIQKREYFDIAMDALRVQPDQRRELWQRIRSDASTNVRSVSDLTRRSPLSRPTVAEEKLLELLLANQELRKIIIPRLQTADYENLASAAIFRALVSLDPDDEELENSLSKAVADDPQATELLIRLRMSEPTTESFDESLNAANSCLNALSVTNLNRKIDELGSELADAERAGDSEKVNTLVMAQLDLQIRRSALLARSQTPDSPDH